MSSPGGASVALQASNVSKRYRHGRLALCGLDLEIRSGSITALVGPNGAGKSTLMKLWVGFERSTAGRVAVLGFDPWRDRGQIAAAVGYVAQDPALYRELTVDEHLAFAGSLNRSFDREMAASRLAGLGIPLRSIASRLSGGQRAQVALALALAKHAEILLLDEPLANLDPLARRSFLGVVREATRIYGTTVVLSSHIVTDIEEACDELVLLADGRVALRSALARAVRDHWIVIGDKGDEAARVGSFLDRRGLPITLVAKPTPSSRAATLEEVVLGYLASGTRNDSSGRP